MVLHHINFILKGALTSKPYAFTSRPWEIKSANSIDIFDGVGSNIRVDFKETDVLRILPRRNANINDYWISDKIRFFYDGLKRQRLLTPMIKKGGLLRSTAWSDLLISFFSFFKVYTREYGHSSLALLTDTSTDLETLVTTTSLCRQFGFLNFTSTSFALKVDNPGDYSFNKAFNELDDIDFCLFIGVNPRMEASVLNLRFHKLYRQGRVNFYNVGSTYTNIFSTKFLSLSSKILLDFVEGKHSLSKKLCQAKSPLIILGSKVFERKDILVFFHGLQQAVLTKAAFFCETDFLPLNVLHTSSNVVGTCELGLAKVFKPQFFKKIKLLYFINNGSITFKFSLTKNLIIIFQNSHGTHYALQATFLIPTTTFVEKAKTYVNIEGRYQTTQKVLNSPFLCKDDVSVLSLLYFLFYKHKKYNVSNIAIKQNVYFSSKEKSILNKVVKPFKPSYVSKIYFKSLVEDFYMTHLLCQTSKILAKASTFSRLKFFNFHHLFK